MCRSRGPPPPLARSRGAPRGPPARRDLLRLLAVSTQVLVLLAGALAVLAALGQRRRAIGVLRTLGVTRVFQARTGLALPVAVSSAEVWALLQVASAGVLVAGLPTWLGYRQPVAAALRG